jgi:hypothetical protein
MVKYLLFMLLMAAGITADPPAILQSYQHTHQLILVFAEDNRSAEYGRAMTELSKDPLGLDRRDMLIFEVFERGGIQPDGSSLSEEETAALRNYFGINGKFAIVILDKRLQEIYRAEQPVSIQEIFKSIG